MGNIALLLMLITIMVVAYNYFRSSRIVVDVLVLFISEYNDEILSYRRITQINIPQTLMHNVSVDWANREFESDDVLHLRDIVRANFDPNRYLMHTHVEVRHGESHVVFEMADFRGQEV